MLELNSRATEGQYLMIDYPTTCPECGSPASPCGGYLQASRCDACGIIVLPRNLEALWARMQELVAHPRFWEAVELLDSRFRDAWTRLLFIPRIWLADRRSRQVEEAADAVDAALAALERESTP